MKTTLAPTELHGEARLLCAELMGERQASWAFGWHPIPDPLKPCARCGGFMGRAGIFVDTTGYAPEDDTFCGECIRTYAPGIYFEGDDIRQVVADLALEQFEELMSEGRAEAERLLGGQLCGNH
jgi:hypothetical protein